MLDISPLEPLSECRDVFQICLRDRLNVIPWFIVRVVTDTMIVKFYRSFNSMRLHFKGILSAALGQ